MQRRSSLSLLVATCLLAAGCGQQSPPPSATKTPKTQSSVNAESDDPVDPERIERLRSLGYLDTAGLPKLAAGKGARILDGARTSPGYTLVVFAGACTAELISLPGEVVRSWSDAACHRWEHAELLPDGDLIVVGARLDEDAVPDPIESGRYVMRLSWDGRVVWRLELNAHHDLSLTPEGNLLTLVLKRRRIPAVDLEADVADDMVTTLSPEGRVLESVSLYDVISSSKVPFTIQKAAGAGALIDLFHSNAVRWANVPSLAARNPIYGRGAVLVTSRHQDELMIFDWSSRQLLWHWGRGVLSGPHEASVLENGRLLVFDNGLARGWSRVVELDPLAPGTLVQFAPGPTRFFSRVMGSCQRLGNGNTLVVNSEGAAAFELSPQGLPVWIYEGTRQTADGYRVKIIRMRRIASAVIERIIARRGP